MTLYDTATEQAVLSCLIANPTDAWAQLQRHQIRRNHFGSAAQQVFDAAASLIVKGQPWDLTILTAILDANNELEALGGVGQFTADYTQFVPLVLLPTHLDTLHQAYLRRSGLTAVASLQKRLTDPAEDPSEAIAGFLGAASALVVQKEQRATVSQMVRSIARRVVDGTDDSRYVPTGIEPLDRQGKFKLNRGDFLIIKAPISGGKSALASQLAVSYLLQGYRVAFYPLEMSSEEVIERMLSQMAGVSPEFVSRFTRAANNDWQLAAAAGHQKKLCDAGGILMRDGDKGLLHIRDDLFSWDAIRADICAEHAKQPFTFVVVDYAQLIQLSPQGNESRQQQLARMSVSARLMAKELQLILCMPSQLDEKSGGAREARDLDASAVAALSIEQDDDKRPAKIKCDKQRRGARYFTFDGLTWDGPNTRFATLL